MPKFLHVPADTEIINFAKSGNKVALFYLGGIEYQLCQSTAPDGRFATWIKQRGGEGLHHICYEVDDIDKALDHAKSQGADLRICQACGVYGITRASRRLCRFPRQRRGRDRDRIHAGLHARGTGGVEQEQGGGGMSTSAGQTLTVGTAIGQTRHDGARRDPGGRALAAGTKIEMPVVVINGAKPGPVFWVNGAIHGDEPEGPMACQLAMKRIDPNKLRGAVVMVPVMNVLAFAAAERGNPLDTFSYDMNRDLSRQAPMAISPTGWRTPTRQAMNAVADIEISIHSGGAHSFLDKAIFVDERPESVELAKAMGDGWGCIMSNFNHVWQPDGGAEGRGQGRHHGRTWRPVGNLARTVPLRGR